SASAVRRIGYLEANPMCASAPRHLGAPRSSEGSASSEGAALESPGLQASPGLWGSPGLLVATIAGIAYSIVTPAGPLLTDAGELGAAGFRLGVAHPTGFPLDMLLLRLSGLLPFGSIQFRQGLVMALVSASVLGVVAHLVFRACVFRACTHSLDAHAIAAA
ncbi:MAG: DUF2723 domain-containing protein, partial [Myxococcota bacterium]